MVVNTQPSSTATAGVAFPIQPVIYEEDQYGNLMTGDNTTVVTATLSSGTGPLQGTLTATVSGGVATFTNLADNTAETIKLKFTSPNLASATSNSVVVSPVAPSQLVVEQQPSSTATPGVAFSTQPVIYEEDQYGNLVTGDNTTVVTASLGSGSGPLQGTLTATVSGGIATFTNLADSTAETITLNFTSPNLSSATSNSIVVSPAATSQTIFGNSTPGTTSYNDSSSIELGVKFQSSQAGYITGIRFYKGTGNTGTHIGNLWTTSGTLLESVTFSGETASGWQQATFATPVAITPGTIYVASYFDPMGHFAYNNNFFTSSFTNGPLTALASSTPGGDGVYMYSASNVFPSNTYQASNYWVDVVFSAGTSTATQLVVHTQPSSTATAGVAFATQPVIYEEDQYGNLMTGDNTTVVTATLGSGSGPLQGTLTATVSGGIATFTNLADSTAETITLNFTSPNLSSATSNSIVVSPAATSQTIFGNTTPGTTSYNDSSSVELGVKFQSSQAGYITGIRFYKGSGNTGTHIGNLWTTSGTLLESVTFSDETASGWQQATFATPVAITPGTIYVASYFAPDGTLCLQQQLLHQLGDQRPADRACQQYAWGQRRLRVQREQRIPQQHVPGEQLLGRRRVQQRRDEQQRHRVDRQRDARCGTDDIDLVGIRSRRQSNRPAHECHFLRFPPDDRQEGQVEFRRRLIRGSWAGPRRSSSRRS